MAEMLKREFDLLAFTVTLDMKNEPTVYCALEDSSDGDISTICDWTYAPEELGLPATIDRRRTRRAGYDFHLPPYLLEELIQNIPEWFEPDGVLWLHLRNPYGYLDMAPWERLMQPALGMPILRLPEFLIDPPRHSLSSLNVALCSSLPAAKSSFMAPGHLLKIAQSLINASMRRTSVHVFGDASMVDELRDRCATEPEFQTRVFIHDPATAEPYAIPDSTSRIVDPMGRLQNPWLLWMRDALQSQSVDMVHFLNHGYYSQDQGALAFAESPLQNEDRRMARFVGAGELSTFLTHVGAWSVCFSSPEDNYSQMGLRHLAHTLAQKRPGPLLYHDLGFGEDFQTLAAAYAFLFGDAPQPPASSQIALYCHPGRLMGAQESIEPAFMSGMLLGSESEAAPGITKVAAPQPESVRAIRASDVYSSVYETVDEVPVWLAAAERHIEQRSLALSKRAISESTEFTDSGLEQSLETLAQIQQIMSEAAEDTQSQQ